MRPEDELAMRIRQYVAASVPPEQVEIITRTVCLTLATLMADPAFTNELVVVRKLQEENAWLKTQYTILKQMMNRVGVKTSSRSPTKTAAKPRKRAPAKKSVAGTSATTSARAASRPNSSFRQGFGEMRG